MKWEKWKSCWPGSGLVWPSYDLVGGRRFPQSRIVQQRKLVEISAARLALEEQIEQSKAGYEHQVLNDLSDAEKKVAELSQDLIKAEQKADEQILRSPDR
jgi:hypothetical protein